jgi:hypothetical protein
VGGNAFIYRDFAHYTVNVLVRYPDFLEARGWLTSRITRWYRDQIPEISGIVRQHPEPWHIPDSDELDTLISDIGVLRKKIPVHNDTKYSYSATSCAIRFLRSIPATARNCFRYVNIFEDREAIAHFECHARGLIPFCRENKTFVSNAMSASGRTSFRYTTRTIFVIMKTRFYTQKTLPKKSHDG